MVKKANAGNVAADMSPPNYRGAVQRLRTIKTKKEKIAGVNGEIADIYAKVEGHKVNKKAARIFLVLDALEKQDRDDVLRSLSGLAEAAGWEEESQDLVDQAEGTVVHGRFGQRGSDEQGAEDELTELEQEAGAEQAGTAADNSNQFLQQARKHLSGKAGEAEPYTGDNSDLAGGDDKSGQ